MACYIIFPFLNSKELLWLFYSNWSCTRCCLGSVFAVSRIFVCTCVFCTPMPYGTCVSLQCKYRWLPLVVTWVNSSLCWYKKEDVSASVWWLGWGQHHCTLGTIDSGYWSWISVSGLSIFFFLIDWTTKLKQNLVYRQIIQYFTIVSSGQAFIKKHWFWLPEPKKRG